MKRMEWNLYTRKKNLSKSFLILRQVVPLLMNCSYGSLTTKYESESLEHRGFLLFLYHSINTTLSNHMSTSAS